MCAPICNPALRYHGGKFRLAPWIMSFFPAHNCYVEPFSGAAGVLLQKERAYVEVYNDLDGMVVNLFSVLRNPESRQGLIEAILLTPYARVEFDRAWEDVADPIESARRLCIRAQMGFGSAGATKGRTGFRIDTKRDFGTAQHLWARYPDALAAAGARFSGVLIENRSAVEVLLDHDSPETLHFVDPPYLPATRSQTRSGRAYRHEMGGSDHRALLDVLRALRGYVIVSGYASDLYHGALEGWRCATTKSRISSARGSKLRNEWIWLNPACAAALASRERQGRLFS